MRKAVNHLKKCDPVLRDIIKRVGLFRMEYGPAEFCSLAEAIVYQQLNGKAAVTIFNRFAELAGKPLTPEGILKLSDQQLRSVGLSKQKSAYLKDLSAKTAAGLLDFARFPELPDREPLIVALNPGAAYGPAKRWPADTRSPGFTAIVITTAGEGA